MKWFDFCQNCYLIEIHNMEACYWFWWNECKYKIDYLVFYKPQKIQNKYKIFKFYYSQILIKLQTNKKA